MTDPALARNALRWAWALLATAAAALLVGDVAKAAAPPPNDFVIVLDRRIGPFDYRDQPYSSAYARAVRAFGVPSSRTSDGTICIGAWKLIGLTIAFRIPYCQGRSAGICGASTKDRRWRTARGLGIGDPESRIRRLYARAQVHGNSRGTRTWWLVTRSVGELGSYGVLSATTRGRRIVEIAINQGCD